jgi:hypothetical protein
MPARAVVPRERNARARVNRNAVVLVLHRAASSSSLLPGDMRAGTGGRTTPKLSAVPGSRRRTRPLTPLHRENFLPIPTPMVISADVEGWKVELTIDDCGTLPDKLGAKSTTIRQSCVTRTSIPHFLRVAGNWRTSGTRKS